LCRKTGLTADRIDRLSRTYEIIIGFLSEDSTKRDNGADDGEEDEEDGGNTLRRQRIGDVAQIVGIAVFYVVDESTEDSNSRYYVICASGLSGKL